MKVNFHTGEICSSGLDAYVSGFVPIEVVRQYSSFRERRGSFGNRWSCSLDLELLPDKTGWKFYDASGETNPVSLVKPELNPWNLEDAALPVYQQVSSNEIALYTAERRRIVFARIANRFRPQRMEDRYGNGLSYRYDRERLIGIRDDAGRELQVKYNGAGLIAEIILVWNVRGPQQVRLARYEYDINEALTVHEDATECRWTYQYQGPLMTSECNPKGGTEYATYDAKSRCIATWRADGSRLRALRYDDVRHVTLVQNALGHQWLYTYDPEGKMLERRDPLGGTRQTHYDIAGGVLGHTGVGADGMAVIKHDGNRTEVTHANGATTKIVAAPSGAPVGMTDACGNEWAWRYDNNGEVTEKVSPLGGVTKFRHDRGFLESMQFPNGAAVNQRLNRQDGTIEMWDSVGSIGALEFDITGQLSAIRDGIKRQVIMHRDSAGRVSHLSDGNGWSVHFRHDPLGNVTAVERSGGTKDEYDYDAFGRLVRHRDSLGNETRLTQGPEGQLTGLQFPNGKSHTIQYDPLDRVIGQQFADGRVERYQYSPDGELAEIVTATGDSTSLEYDPVGLIVHKQFQDRSDASLSYDPMRRLLTFDAPGAAVSFEYDPDDNLIAETQNDHRIDLRYDSAGNCTSWRPADAPAVNYEYDLRGRVVRIADSELGVFSFEYSLVDELTRLTYPDGTTLDYSYDHHGFLVAQRLVRGGKCEWDRSYRYDEAGRLIRTVTNGRSTGYHFNAVDQLVGVDEGSGGESRTYDAAGNVISIGAHDVVYDAAGRLVRCADLTMEYDSGGFPVRLRSDAGSYDLEWDGEGRLATCVVDGKRTIRFKFDMAARLLELQDDDQVTSFLWCGALLHLEFREGEVARRYVYHPQLLFPLADSATGEHRYFVPDFKGQVAASFTEPGELVAYEYSAWGELRGPRNADQSHPFRLPGQLALCGLPFHINRFRLFSPKLGRYLTADPLGLGAGTNLYEYSVNPIQGVDLVGLCDGEVFYRAMSDAELKAVMKDCKLSNRPESESKCHEAFVTQRKDYSQKLQARHPDKYPNLVEFCCKHGTAAAMSNPAISAASNSAAASRMFPTHSRTIKGLTNIIHLKFEQVGSRADQALNYGLRRDSIGTFNDRVKSAKAQPGGQSCSK